MKEREEGKYVRKNAGKIRQEGIKVRKNNEYLCPSREKWKENFPKRREKVKVRK